MRVCQICKIEFSDSELLEEDYTNSLKECDKCKNLTCAGNGGCAQYVDGVFLCNACDKRLAEKDRAHFDAIADTDFWSKR